MPSKNKQVKVTLVKSVISALPKHKDCIKGLGLRKIRSSSILQDTPSVRGMINKVSYLLLVEDV